MTNPQHYLNMPTQDHADAVVMVDCGNTRGEEPSSGCAGIEAGFTPAERLIASGKLLLAYLVEGIAAPDEEAWLPLELQRVRQLPQTARQCFVLRVLDGWSRQRCADALAISEELVDCQLGIAAMSLALAEQMEQPRSRSFRVPS